MKAPRTDQEKFGQRVRTLRKRRGLTIKALAAKADMSAENICLLERGHRDVGRKTIVGLADALGVSPGELVGRAKPLSEAAIEMARLYDEADPDVATAVLRILQALKVRR